MVLKADYNARPVAFESGTRVGPYQIVSPLGAGGMGEVYRARDTRLDRTVAIKVLTGALAADAESRRRFEEEARAIAALNDPRICTIHDVGREGDLDYLVLEFLDGETLAERIGRSGALPLDEALDIAIQVGEALDRAHRAGIAHRDLKPGNVMLVRRPGAAASDVKLLDFGVASRTAATRPAALDPALVATIAPSMMATRPPSAGASSSIAGTVQYMAPEQLDGQPGDHRSDIFSFGCVLYEMLAGRKAFEANTAMTAIATIMNTEPPPIPALVSAGAFVDHLMRRCLEKDPERRWQNIGDLVRELWWARTQPTLAGPAAHRWRGWTMWQLLAAGIAIAALAVAGPLVVLGAMHLSGIGGQDDALPLLQLEVSTPPTDDVSGAISPDGALLAFVAINDHVPLLWIRALDSVEDRPLAGTEGASFPFWSPDSKSIGFFADNKLKRIEAVGGAPIVVADAPTGRGGDWGVDGTILFAPGVNAPIKRVSAQGGTVTDVTKLNAGAGPSHRRPQFLPDGAHFLFNSSLGTADTNGIYIGSLDGAAPMRIISNDDGQRFAPPNHLLEVHQDNLQAFAFDPKTGRTSGAPVILAHGVNSAGLFGASHTGVLAYRAGAAQERQLAWVDRTGAVLQKIGEPVVDGIASPELSPDERFVAVFLHPSAGEDNDVWVYELARYVGRPVTTGPPADAHPIWDPDGQAVIFNSARAGTRGPTRFPLSGAPPTLLTADPTGTGLSITRDRRFLLQRRDRGTTGVDLIATSLADRREIRVTQLAGDETEGQFSPDGRWVAFVGSLSGRPEVYVQSFPDGGSRTQVSLAGGAQVRWSADGKEIYYIAPDNKLMAVAFSVHDTMPDLQRPVALFQTHLANGNNVIGNKAQYAVSRDGRFLLNTVIETPSSPIVVNVNWARRLGR